MCGLADVGEHTSGHDHNPAWTDAPEEGLTRVRLNKATPAGVTITALKGVVGTERRDDASSLPWWRVMHDLQDCSADAGGNPMLSAPNH